MQSVGVDERATDLEHRCFAASGAQHLGDVHDRPRAADRDVEAERLDHAHDLREVRADELPALLERPAPHRAVESESLGEPDCAELQAACAEHLVALADHELGAAAADVHEQMALLERRDRLQHAEPDETRLFGSGDHRDLDAGLVPGAAYEVVPVLGLAHGTGRHRVQLRVVAVDEKAEPAERVDPAVDRVGREPLHVAGPRSEPDDLLLAVDDVESVVAGRAGDDEMERVGADIDGRERCAATLHPLHFGEATATTMPGGGRGATSVRC